MLLPRKNVVVELTLWWLACVWFAWIAFNLLLMAVLPGTVPSFNGFRVFMPPALAVKVTADEWDALYVHELGHRRRGHVWANFALTCFFLRATKQERRAQELEADDYAFEHGHALHLSTALIKLSDHPFDRYRAERLWCMYWETIIEPVRRAKVS